MVLRSRPAGAQGSVAGESKGDDDMGIPTAPEHLTPEWFATHLGWNVDAVDTVEIGAGIGVSSAVYRATLRGGGDDVPPSVAVKLIAIDPAAAFTSSALRFYTREVNYYDRLRTEAPVRSPFGYYGEVADDGQSFVLVIEDLAGNRIIDQTTRLADDDADRIIDAIADWHAHWWNRADGLCDDGTAVALADPIYPAVLPGLFREGWAILNGSERCAPPDALQPLGQRFPDVVAEMLNVLSTGPATLLHGDVRVDNIMFSPSDEPIFMDFQILGVGSAAYDLAYFITQSLDVDAVRERQLFDRWTARLAADGVAAGDLDRLWDQYRLAAAFCLVYPVVASRGMDLDDERQVALATSMMARFSRAAVDLDLAAVMP